MKQNRHRYAGLFYRRERIFIQPYYQTTDGVLLGGEPVEDLDSRASDQKLGEALLRALLHTKNGIPHPIDWNMVPQPLYAAAGVKGWAAFVKGTLSCEIADDGTNMKFTPMRNAGARAGFQFLNDLSVELPSTATADDIGRVIRVVMESAE